MNKEEQVKSIKNDSSDTGFDDNEVYVYLDIDQLKHQPKEHPIGTRQASGGTKFDKEYSSKEWHKKYTIQYMKEWAMKLNLEELKKEYHGQKNSIGGIHYEGFAVKLDGKIYVLFHCYPGKDFNGKNYK